MFDWYVGRRDATRKRARWVGAAVAVSAVAHAAAAAVLLLSAMWHIDKLDAGRLAVVQAAIPGGRLDPGPMPAAGQERAKEPRKRESAAERATARAPAAEAQEVGGDGGDEGEGEGGGGGGEGEGEGDGGGGCLGVVCAGGPGPDISVDLPEDPCVRDPARCRRSDPEVVPERVLEGHRIAGETRIPPPEPVKQQMLHGRIERISATLRVCIDRRGAVAAVDLLRSSSYPAWDRRLVQAVRGWRYRPYRLEGGAPVAACGPVTFIYGMK